MFDDTSNFTWFMKHPRPCHPLWSSPSNTGSGSRCGYDSGSKIPAWQISTCVPSSIGSTTRTAEGGGFNEAEGLGALLMTRASWGVMMWKYGQPNMWLHTCAFMYHAYLYKCKHICIVYGYYSSLAIMSPRQIGIQSTKIVMMEADKHHWTLTNCRWPSIYHIKFTTIY